jgi:hypothetical protein
MSTVRYYQRRELLAVPNRQAGSIDRYSACSSAPNMEALMRADEPAG